LYRSSAVPRIDEGTISGWTGPASDSEDERSDRARTAVTAAIGARRELFEDARLSVYPKGSYPNYTNVIRDSDVDLAVEMTSVVYVDSEHQATGMTKEDFGISAYDEAYEPVRLKDDVERALVDKFGRASVSRGKRALHVRESSTRLAADVVPCYSKRIFTTPAGAHINGIVIRPDGGGRWIDNFPVQHLQEGKAKNTRTSRRYKSCVRILKRLENKMVADGVIEVVPSFLIESLVWNVPDSSFSRGTWTDRVQGILVHVWGGLEHDSTAASWVEANGVQLLFGGHQSWTRAQARQFSHDAWNYLGYGS
jgi:hypothetical protein